MQKVEYYYENNKVRRTTKLFTPHAEATFLRRINRFAIAADLEGEEVYCHCPNPGKLLEILLPGTRVILEKAGTKDQPGIAAETRQSEVCVSNRRETTRKATLKPGRKTEYTLVAAFHRERIVPLYSARSNLAAKDLILPVLFPEAREVRPEYTLGSSRFDFFIRDREGASHLLEVKACSLVEQGVGMFPDAPSLRASRHLEELARLTGEGYSAHALFLLSHGPAEIFIPHLHTDPLFAKTFYRVSDKVKYHVASLKADGEGGVVLERTGIPVDYRHRELASADSGNYLMLLEFPVEKDLTVGSLGRISFSKGWYMYAGSARKNLSARIARHTRKNGKALHWHIDYLIPQAGRIKGFALASYRNLECALASSLEKIGGAPCRGFGSSDCRCISHLYYFKQDPLTMPAFTELLVYYRHVEALRFGDERNM